MLSVSTGNKDGVLVEDEHDDGKMRRNKRYDTFK